MITTRPYRKMDLKTSMKLRILHHECGVSCYQLAKRYGRKYSERTIYRHAKRAVDEKDVFDRRKENKGHPKKLTMRMERIIIRTLSRLIREQVGFSSQKIRKTPELPLNISSHDIKRCLGKYGYIYVQSRKK